MCKCEYKYHANQLLKRYKSVVERHRKIRENNVQKNKKIINNDNLYIKTYYKKL